MTLADPVTRELVLLPVAGVGASHPPAIFPHQLWAVLPLRLLKLHFDLYFCMFYTRGHACSTCVETGRHPVGSHSLSFHRVDPMGHAQVTGLCSKLLYVLSHLASPRFSLKPWHPSSTSGAEANDLTCGAFAIRSLERRRETRLGMW